MNDETIYTLRAPQPPAGYWLIGGDMRIYVMCKPSWLHRKMTLLLLGWEWGEWARRPTSPPWGSE